MKSLLIKIAVIFLLITATLVSVSAQMIGYVDQVKGNWYLSGSDRLLKRFDQLPANGVIRVQSPKDSDHIILTVNGVRMGRRCPSSDCAAPIKLPGIPQKGVIDTIREYSPWIKSILLVPIFGKGGELSEDIVMLRNGKAELTSLTNLEGENCLRWRKVPLTEKESFGEWSKPLKLKDNKKIVVTGLEPGLYEFAFANPGENCLVNYPRTAWILASPAKNFDKNKSSFQEFKKKIDEWNEKEEELQLREETVASLLRAHLFSLVKEAVAIK
jgi:hypothetical protein